MLLRTKRKTYLSMKKNPHFHINHLFLSFCFYIVISNKGLHLKHLNYLPHFFFFFGKEGVGDDCRLPRLKVEMWL